jgi:hypothetical protein
MHHAMRRTTRTTGQAIVEFALAATLIFFMLTATVDLGLIFFTLQGLHNAAQEGATYGSRWLITSPSGVISLDVDGIRDRTRHEGGTRGGIGFANLLDLNNNQSLDVGKDTDGDGKIDQDATVADYRAGKASCDKLPSGACVFEDYIQVGLKMDTDGDGVPEDLDCPSAALNNPLAPCYVKVTIKSDYKPVFPLAPAIGKGVQLTSTYYMRLRSNQQQGGAPPSGQQPVFQTATPTPSPTATPSPTPFTLKVTVQYYRKVSNKGYLKVLVQLPNNSPATGATVSAAGVGTLAENGNGYYSACGFNNPPNSVTISATSGSGSGSASAGISNGSVTCP